MGVYIELPFECFSIYVWSTRGQPLYVTSKRGTVASRFSIADNKGGDSGYTDDSADEAVGAERDEEPFGVAVHLFKGGGDGCCNLGRGE